MPWGTKQAVRAPLKDLTTSCVTYRSRSLYADLTHMPFFTKTLLRLYIIYLYINKYMGKKGRTGEKNMGGGGNRTKTKMVNLS